MQSRSRTSSVPQVLYEGPWQGIDSHSAVSISSGGRRWILAMCPDRQIDSQNWLRFAIMIGFWIVTRHHGGCIPLTFSHGGRPPPMMSPFISKETKKIASLCSPQYRRTGYGRRLGGDLCRTLVAGWEIYGNES
jgi:hypothetical protein